MVKVSLIAVSRPIAGGGDPRRLVEVAVKTSSGRVSEKGFEHYLMVERSPEELNKWLIEAAEKYPSVLEHVVFTFMIEDISRVTSHQLVRHRIASYTQESLRYSVLAEPEKIRELIKVAIEKAPIGIDDVIALLSEYFVVPDIELGIEEDDEYIRYRIMWAIVEALYAYSVMLDLGVPQEDARYVLPMATKTRLMMTVNLRELLHIGCMRLSQHAQIEIREVVKEMFDEVKEKLGFPIWEMKERFCKTKHD